MSGTIVSNSGGSFPRIPLDFRPITGKKCILPVEQHVNLTPFYQSHLYYPCSCIAGMLTQRSTVVIERATVHAVQDIAAGQELLTTYIEFCQPRAQRQSYLLQRWGFRCGCQACKPSSTFGKASEKRRKRLSDIRKFLESRKHITSMKARTSDETALAAAIEFAELLQEEGIHNMELATA